jgi:hypothetical protein
LPFRIPRLDLSDDSLIAGVLPNYAEIRHLRDISDVVGAIIDLAFEANPRAVKRFVNAFGLLTRIVEIRGVEVDRRLLAITLGAELRWPEEFEDLRAAVRSGDEDPLRDIRGAENELLSHYASTLLPGKISAGTLDGILRLTAAFVAAEEEDEEVIDMRTGRPGTIAYNRPRLMATLEELGWAKSSRSRGNFYHSAVENIRFRVLQRVVRLEKRERGDWSLHQSWSIARHTDLAIAEATRLVPEDVAVTTRLVPEVRVPRR